MLVNLFPQTVYMAQDTTQVRATNAWFDRIGDRAKNYYNPQNELVCRSTLNQGAGYTPGRAEVLWDLSQEPEWASWVNWIEYHVECYLEQMAFQPYKIQVVNTWLNEQRKQHKVKEHMHYGYSLSGVYYPQIPQGSGAINFSSGRESSEHTLAVSQATPMNFNEWVIPVQTGTILIFNSTMLHGVPAMEFEGVRRSVAFDCVLTRGVS